MSVPLRQKELVQDTWERVEPVSETAARLFYDRLLELNPQLQALFPAEKEEMEEQGCKLMQMVSIAARGLDRLDELSPAVEDLGRRHVSYGVRDADYDSVGAALLWTLKQGLGEETFTPEFREAWTATYALLAGVMKDAAATAPARIGYQPDGPVPGEPRQ
jgi:hemoglobin-like flavoprotein